MHPQQRTRLIVATVALATTAAVLAFAIIFSGVELTTIGSFAALIALGWLIVNAAGRFVSRSASESANEVPVSAPTVREPLSQSETPQVAPVAARVAGHAEKDDRVPARVPIEPADALDALAEEGEHLGSVVSTGLWLEDPATATLRLVAGGGRMPPEDTPLPVDEGIVGEALRTNASVWREHSLITRGDASVSVWRVALPIDAGELAGIAVLDLAPSAGTDVTPRDGRAPEVLETAIPGLAVSLAVHVARSEAETARQLIEAARVLSRTADPAGVLDAALDHAVALASADTASIMLVEPTGDMRIVRSKGLEQKVVGKTTVSRGEGIAGWVLSSGQALLVEDLPQGQAKEARGGVRSAVSVPISDEEGTIGVLNVGSRAFPARFTRAHLDVMDTFGRQVCGAYRTAIALAEARDLYLSTLKTLAVAMETKDPYARGSTEQVLDLAMALAQALGVSSAQKESLEIAALFHDMGMSAAGGGVIDTDRPLTTVERGLVKMHPAIAAEALGRTPALRDVAPIVYHHHERYDGKGYVGGIGGDAIPLGARILAVVDAFVAMTSPRPYRGALTVEQAVGELEQNAGTQFDPRVVEEFIAMLRADGRYARQA
jgi:response regulator RpfG family c-di-GMP phosphodiesterase